MRIKRIKINLYNWYAELISNFRRIAQENRGQITIHGVKNL